MYAQGNHQSGLAYNEVDYPHCKIYLMEPLLYQSLAQRKMEGNNEFYFWWNHTMNGSFIIIISPALDHMTNIDQKGPGYYWGLDPFVIKVFYF